MSPTWTVPYLTPLDYAIVVVTLVTSAALGLYNGFFKVKVMTFAEYVLGSRTIPAFPILMSTFATVVGAGYIVGAPAEVYIAVIGPIFQLTVWIPLAFVVNDVILPLYKRTSSKSIFEFYEIRFMKTLKQIVTAVYIAVMIFFGSITLYGPSTAFNLVTGIDVWIILTTVNSLCMLYTILGGMRAVVFADMIQGLEMLIAIFAVIIIGTYNIGGFQRMWKINSVGRRLEQDFSFDLTSRNGFWGYAIGWPFSYICYYCCNQSFMQRLLACENLQKGRRVSIGGSGIMLIFHLLLVYLGLLVYATYSDCDPLLSNRINNYNQIAPLYVMQTFQEYPGLAGVYFAAILSASLSTLSSCYNALAAICVESFIFPKHPNMTETKRTNACKAIAFCFGILALLGVLIAHRFPNLFQASTTVGTIITVPTFTLLIVGTLCPQANRKGCVAAFVTGVLLGVWLVAGELFVPRMAPTNKPFGIEGCSSNLTLWSNSSMTTVPSTDGFLEVNSTEWLWDRENPDAGLGETEGPSDYLKILFPLYNLSYLWFAVAMFFVTFVFSIFFTYILGREDASEKVVELLPEAIQRFHKFLGPRFRYYLLCESTALLETRPYPNVEMDQLKLPIKN